MSSKLLVKAVELVEISSGNEDSDDDDSAGQENGRIPKLGVPGKISKSTNPNSANDWKGLMERMQKNQKSSAIQKKNGRAGSSGGHRSGGAVVGFGRGLKRTASQPLAGNNGNISDSVSNSGNFGSIKKVRLSEELDLFEEFENYENNSAVSSGSRSGSAQLGSKAKSNSAPSAVEIQQPKYEQVFPIFGGKAKPEETSVSVSVKLGQNDECWKQDRIPVSLYTNDSGNTPLEPVAKNGNGKAKNENRRQCPFYKKIPDTTFSVDAFSYGVIPGIDVYFLSHFHSDHYMGLTKKFSKTIICSPATGNLVKMKLGVSENCIRKLELNTIYSIQGTDVVLIDANHCPGSVMFILRLPNRKVIFHTGDFRFTPDMLENPFVSSLSKVDSLYLDTTYCDPKFDFPSQTDAIAQVLQNVKRHIETRPRTLIICGAYCIGKERVFFTLAEALKMLVFCEPDKRRVIKALETPSFVPLLGDSESACQIHVLPMRFLNPPFLSDYLAQRTNLYNNIVAIKPTGWEFSRTGAGMVSKKSFNDTVTVIGVPYSEHSSFSELRDFVSTLKPFKVQPTVNVGSEPKRVAMTNFFNKWLGIR